MKVIDVIENRCNCKIAEVTAKNGKKSNVIYKNNIDAPYSITIDTKNTVIEVKYKAASDEAGKYLQFAWELLASFIEEKNNGSFQDSFMITDDASKSENLDNMISQALNTLASSDLFDKAAIFFFNTKRGHLRPVDISGKIPYSNEDKQKFLKNNITIAKETFDNFPESVVISEGNLSTIFQNLEKDTLSNFPIISPIVTGKKIYGILATYSNNTYGAKHIHACASTAGFIAATISANIVYRAYALSLSSEKQLAGQLKKNERLFNLGSYAAAIVHEIKNPLISIGGFAKRLINAINDPNLQKMANIISTESERLERLAEDILSYTKKHEPNKSHISLTDELENIRTLFDMRSTALNIPINLDIPSHIMVRADKNHLRQVLVNLVANAMTAIGSDGKINIAYENRGDFHILKISDTGGGIPEDCISKLFKPFFTTSPKGTGLGLSISKKIMTNHGGDITVRNIDEGAEFTLLLPK